MKIFLKITYLGLFLTVIYGEKCEKKKQCENLVVKENDPSVFVIYAAGRLGNHLMAFSAVLALGKMLNIRPFVQGDTAEYLKQYFVAENIPVFEDTFCNPDDIKKVLFDHDVDYLIERKDLHKGHIIGLWPWGYKEKAGICCPADELMSIVTKNYLAELKSVLKFQPKFNEHTQKVKNEVAQSLNSTLDQITFVGIHNRRTDYNEYMKTRFNKNPLKKSYFKHAMEHFREECDTEKIAFLYVSDDMEWGKTNLKSVQKKYQDLFFVGIGKEDVDAIGYDMALMASSDSTIISRGSFSSFCAILAGGEYYGEYGPIVTLTHLVEQQEKTVKKKGNKRKTY